MPRWWCLPFLVSASFAEREALDAAKSRVLLQHRSTLTLQEVPALATSHNNPLGDVDAIVPDGLKTTFPNAASRMVVLAMLLLLSLMCILIDVIGRFLSHVADIVLDDCRPSDLRQTLEPHKELTALAFIRLVGAVHLVMFSYGPVWCAGFNQWGASWFSMYFILTGLGSAYVKLEKRTPATSWLPKGDSFLRHLALVYPLYLLAFAWTLLNSHILAPQVEQEPLVFWNVLVEFSMLQAFLPQSMLHHYNPPSSFFSALALCWILEEALYKLGSACWTCGKWARRCTCFVVLMWVILWPYGAPGKLVPRQDNIFALSFLHCYFCGVLLAHCLHEKPSVGTKGRSTISASGASLILATVFLGFSDPATATSWACFLLLPAQCLLIFSLGRGDDPLAKLFSTWPLPLFSELALGIYMFQAPAKQMLDAVMGWQGNYTLNQMAVLLLILSLLAALAQLLQKPMASLFTS